MVVICCTVYVLYYVTTQLFLSSTEQIESTNGKMENGNEAVKKNDRLIFLPDNWKKH